MFDRDAREDAADNPAQWEAVEEAAELLSEERYVDALRQLKTVLQKDPTNGYAYYFTGLALFEVGEVEPARDAYRAAVRHYPKHLGARLGLAHTERLLGNTREAIRVGLVALEQAPDDGDALYVLGLSYHARGEHNSAREYFHAFLQTRPELEVRVEVEELLVQMNESAPKNANDSN